MWTRNRPRSLLCQGHWGYSRVLRQFGRSILRPDGGSMSLRRMRPGTYACAQRFHMLCSGEIDRDALGDAVFSDPAARRRLNGATHLPVAVALIGGVLAAWLTFKPVVVRGTQCSHVHTDVPSVKGANSEAGNA